MIHILRTSTKLLTVEVQVIAAVEETKAIATGATAQSACQNTGKRAVVDGGDRARGGHLVAAGDDGVIATLGVGLAEVEVVGDGVLHILSLAGRAIARGKGQSGGSEEDSGGEELHFDGLVVDKHEK